jgi:tRNA nucleotidyltransferase/poly(A) polymerase
MLASTKKILPPWKIFRTIADTAEQMGVEAYVVGGFVRDRLLAN